MKLTHLFLAQKQVQLGLRHSNHMKQKLLMVIKKNGLQCFIANLHITLALETLLQFLIPQLNVDFGEWGNAFTPRFLNVSTGKEQIGRLSVKYTCSNDVEATYDPPFLPASTWDFGNCSHSYTLSA